MFRALLLIGLTAALAGGAVPSQARENAGCTQLLRVFYVKSANLKETVSAHWSYDDGADHKAVIDTKQTGALNLKNGQPPSKADWRKGHGYAFFEELQGGCRIPNYRQGQLYDAQPMSYTLHGDWRAGNDSGTCDKDQTSDRLLRGTFIRRSLNWHYPSVGFRWDVPTASMPPCSFKAADPEGDLASRRLHDAYPFTERPTKQLTLTKKALLGKTTIMLPILVHGTKSSGGSRWTYDLTGKVVLQRFKPYR